MAFVASSSYPTTQVPRERVLTANIHISTLQLIAALLLTLMLLWHISTVTLIENYQMPSWWVELFVAELASGWRVAAWAAVMILVPLDCVHALLCLDWWCFHLHGRGGGKQEDSRIGKGDEKTLVGISMDADIDDRSRRSYCASTMSQLYPRASSLSTSEPVSTPSSQPHTYHPLRRALLLPRTQNMFLSILDIAMLAVLVAHTTSYFLSLPRYLAHCKGAAVESAPDIEFGDDKVLMSARDRCVRLNVDIHIAGGFAVFMAIVLGLLHIAALVVRGWERVQLGKDGVLGKSMDDESADDCGRERNPACSKLEGPGLVTRSKSTTYSKSRDNISRQPSPTASFVAPRNSASISAEERSTGGGFADRSAEHAAPTARRRAVRSDPSDTSNARCT